jgi:hypothetical protein
MALPQRHARGRVEVLAPSAAKRSALPHVDVMPRLPCFMTGTPAAATTSVAMVETLKPPAWSPPGADDIDRAGRPRAGAGVERERADGLGKCRDLARGLPLRRKRG